MAEQRDVSTLTRDTGEDIAKYRLVRLDSSGNDTFVYNDAGEFPLAASRGFVASGDAMDGWLLTNKNGTIKLEAAASISAEDDVYAAADGKVTGTANLVKIGKALTAASGSGSIIEVLPEVSRVPYVNTSAEGVGASSTDENAFAASVTIPAQELKAGSLIRIKVAAIVTDQNANPQCDVRLKLGTETLVTATVAAAADNDQCLIEADVVIRTVGATGTLFGYAASSFDAAGTALGSAQKAQATEDTTSGLAVTVTAQFDASHGDNDCQLDLLEVQHLR